MMLESTKKFPRGIIAKIFYFLILKGRGGEGRGTGKG
jgi:hypothetical protein